MLTIPYFNVERFIAAPESDPLCQMLAAEDELHTDQGEIEALIETQLAFRHVAQTTHYEKE